MLKLYAADMDNSLVLFDGHQIEIIHNLYI